MCDQISVLLVLLLYIHIYYYSSHTQILVFVVLGGVRGEMRIRREGWEGRREKECSRDFANKNDDRFIGEFDCDAPS